MQSQKLGGRLPLLDPAELTEAQKALYEHVDLTLVPWADAAGFQSRTADGRLIGPFNPILFSPEMTSRFLDVQASEEKHTSLSKRIRQVVILSVGAVWKAEYEIYAHSAVARKIGLSEVAIQALLRGEASEDLSGQERIAQQFARQLTAERRIEPPLYEAAEAAFGPKGLVDMTVLIGSYMVVCALLNVFAIPAPAADEQAIYI
jgi:4-carboxymuconolactone decarboxylase